MPLHTIPPKEPQAKVATRVKRIDVDGAEALTELVMDKAPSYEELKRIIEPLIGVGRWFQHVNVWDDFGDGVMRALDMFVDENGLLAGLERNEKATTIYRRGNLLGMSAVPPVSNPELLNFIVGPAVLFDRKVWF